MTPLLLLLIMPERSLWIKDRHLLHLLLQRRCERRALAFIGQRISILVNGLRIDLEGAKLQTGCLAALLGKRVVRWTYVLRGRRPLGRPLQMQILLKVVIRLLWSKRLKHNNISDLFLSKMVNIDIPSAS